MTAHPIIEPARPVPAVVLPLPPARLQALRGAVAGTLPSPRATPLTFGYLATLGVTAWLLHALGDPAVRHLTAAISTDVSNLRADPLGALGASAMVADQPWLTCVGLFCVSLAPLERRAGSARTAAVFAAGHVIATLATELPVALGLSMGWLPPSAAHRLDFGVSYGMYACAGALVATLPPRWRRRALAVAAASTVLAALADPSDAVGCAGHPVALVVGVACGRLLRRGHAGGAGHRTPTATGRGAGRLRGRAGPASGGQRASAAPRSGSPTAPSPAWWG